LRNRFKKYIIIVLYFALISLVSPVAANVPELYEEIRIHNAKIEARLSNWASRTRLHADHMNISKHPKIIKWREQLTELDFHDEISSFIKLNRMINEDITYIDDYHHFHKTDYWADPETALTEGGDCEDIALVKAATLRRFDWPDDKVHLLAGFLTERGKKESHAVLMVETSTGDQLVLRSITDDVVHLSEFAFIPVYAVDQFGTLIVKSKNPDHLLSTEKTAAK
jgi:predicted transglutaminase-like cysteine proteinase